MGRDNFEKLCFEYQLVKSLSYIKNEKNMTYAVETRYYSRAPIIGTYYETKRDIEYKGIAVSSFAELWKDLDNKEDVSVFCEKNKICMSECIRDNHISKYKKRISPEKYLKKTEGAYPPTKTSLTFYYEFSITNSEEELETIISNYNSLIDLENNKICFEAGEAFYEKVFDTKNIDLIIDHFKLPEEYGDFSIKWYAVYLDRIYYFDPREQNNEYKFKNIFFADMGLKNLSSLQECAGLGFAIANQIFKHYRVKDIELIEVIHVRPDIQIYDKDQKWNNICFNYNDSLNAYFGMVDEQKKNNKLRDW